MRSREHQKWRRRLLAGACAALLAPSFAARAAGDAVTSQNASPPTLRYTLPIPSAPSRAVVKRDLSQSTQDFPALPTAPAGAPNVLLILTDDTGFGATSAFGGPVPTPNLERLAASGVDYTQFHTTAMCSPTRAALLTGRNHHSVGVGTLTDFADGFPGYDTFIPKSAATIARTLELNGYNTAFFGKHHNVPTGQMSAAGPFDQWPTGLGFEYFYGFLGADTDQWRPALYRGTQRVPNTDSGEVLDKRLADDAINWIHNQKAAAPDKPFFIYYAPGSTHTPHQAPADWIARFHGRFDGGWDKVRQETLARQKRMHLVPGATQLPKWPDDVPQWDSLSPDDKRVQARYMEIYAGMLAYQDAQLGRIFDELTRMGVRDNTLVILVVGDNGADAAGSPAGGLSETGEIANKRSTLQERLAHLDEMGGPRMGTNYSTGWALAMDTPFPFYKQIASHLGGTRNGAIISWPAGIHSHGIRTQYHHVIDIAPTILEAAKIPQPQSVDGAPQKPFDGVSMVYTFDNPKAPSKRTTQYYEMLGNRAIYHDGWLANTTPVREPWKMASGPRANENLTDQYKWELYNLKTDYNQTKDLSAKSPEKLKEMEALFDAEAARNQVYPLDDRTGFDRISSMRNAYVKDSDTYVYWGKGVTVSYESAPQLPNRAFTIEADLAAPAGKANGVIAALGSLTGGWSFFLKDGYPTVAHALTQLPEDQFRLVSPVAVPTGKTTHVTFDFKYDGGGAGHGGVVTISIDGRAVANGKLNRTITYPAPLGEPFDVGQDSGVPVVEDFAGNGAFGGDIQKLTVRLGPIGKAR
jgi:arylsulfatase A-like enzyme